MPWSEAANVQSAFLPLPQSDFSCTFSYPETRDWTMTLPNDRAPSHDERWGDHVPWSLRYSVLSQKGDFKKFMTMLANRLHQLINYNEANLPNMSHFLARLVSESFGRFHAKRGTFAEMVFVYFSPVTIEEEANSNTGKDPEEENCRRLRYVDPNAYVKALAIEQSTKPARYAAHWHDLIAERLEVLHCIFVLIHQDQKNNAMRLLVRDVRRFAAESGVLLDVKGDPQTLVPMEEPLLQKEVINRLLPRLEAKYPERAEDLIKTYHDLLKGVDTNTVFGNAFKALEQLAREISGDKKLELSDRQALEKSFPMLHGTIRETIIKLAAHRGDEAGHGREGPDEYEIRYLLLTICNVALLLLEYKEHCG
jgi:hypothetical protein